MASYDVIVIGLGGMGSAAAYQLAKRGRRVLGLEQYSPAHNRGSSHGQSRIIRQAYFEDPAYVPLLLRAYELWEQLERETGQDLLTITGGLMLGLPSSSVVSGSTESARKYNLPHEILDAAEIRRRFPAFQPDDRTIALYETKAGFLRPEATVQAHLDRAAQLGAELHFEEPVLSWTVAPSGDRVEVMTARGRYEAGRLVIAPGAWAPRVLADLGLPLEVQRQVMYWFEPVSSPELFQPDRFPIFVWELPGSSAFSSFYGIPAHEGTHGAAKVAYHTAGKVCTPETIDRTVHEDEIARMRACVAEHLPLMNGTLLNTATCMYTMTPDQHFVIATHPAHPQVAIASGFSGHGYKFASVTGEILADLALTGTTRHPISLFSPQRFAH